MEALFLKLVNMSITASWLVLAVIVFRFLLKKAPKYIRVILWGLVGMRLVFPFSIESVLSLIPSAEPLPEEFLYAPTPQVNTGIPYLNNAINPVIAESLTPAGMTSANPTQIWSFIFSWIWLTGVVAMASYALISYLIVRRKVSASIPVGKNLRLCDHIETPFILGIIKPKIYLPSTLDQQTTDHVLSHENAHLKRHDHWWKPLGFTLLTVYWFNPIMWLAYVLLCRDIEMACDEKVIKELGADEKKAYSTALLQCSVPRRLIAACPLAFGEVGVKARIKSVLNYKKPAFWVIVFAVVASIAVAVCFLTDPAKKSTPYPITSTLNSADVEWAQATLWGDETEHVLLTGDQIEELTTILNDLEEDDFVHSKVPDYNVSIMIHCEETAILLHWDGDYVEFTLDSDTAQSLDEDFRYVCNEPLNAFIAGITGTNRLAAGNYITTELVYWPVYSSYHWAENPTYQYLVTEDHFYSYYENETFEVDWQWRTVAESAKELGFFFEWYKGMSDLNLAGIPATSGTSRYQKIDTTHHLLLIDDVLYLIEGYDTGVYMTNVSAIYRLEPYDETDVPVTYPDSTTNGEVNNLYSTISGQIYDTRSAQDMLIRNAILSNQNVHNSEDILYAESHRIHGEVIACGAETEDDSPVGYRVVDVMAVVMKAERKDTGIVPGITAEPQIIIARIKIDEYPDGTLKLAEYEENPDGEVTSFNGLDIRPYMQACYDQAVKYWGLNTDLMVDELLDTISSSPAQYSNAQPYIDAHWGEYEQLIYLGDYTLNNCLSAFLDQQASGIRAEIMAAACRDIAESMGEDISFEGQYVNGAAWFDAFHANALELYEANGLDALAETNHASWVLLNILVQTPTPIQ